MLSTASPSDLGGFGKKKKEKSKGKKRKKNSRPLKKEKKVTLSIAGLKF
jgi:hypothetical protein